MHPTVASCSIIIPLSEHQHWSAASRNHCIRPASPLSMYCGGATHFMLHIAGSGALNNPFNPPIIDRETAICPVIPGTAQTTSGEFVRPKDHVHTFFFMTSTMTSPIFSIFIFSDKKLPTLLGQLDPALQQQNSPMVKRYCSCIMGGQKLIMGFRN